MIRWFFLRIPDQVAIRSIISGCELKSGCRAPERQTTESLRLLQQVLTSIRTTRLGLPPGTRRRSWNLTISDARWANEFAHFTRIRLNGDNAESAVASQASIEAPSRTCAGLVSRLKATLLSDQTTQMQFASLINAVERLFESIGGIRLPARPGRSTFVMFKPKRGATVAPATIRLPIRISNTLRLWRTLVTSLETPFPLNETSSIDLSTRTAGRARLLVTSRQVAN